MTRPRSELICLDDTPYYHCISRCVRRAFLCGRDRFSGRSFEHRRQWLVDRIKRQAAAFAIDICAYAIMSNHYHLVLHVDVNRAKEWDDDEVLERWCELYRGPILVQRYRAGASLSVHEQAILQAIVDELRQRLMSISWFMASLNETVARDANREDQCTGRFWEGRFTSRALLDGHALLSCMAYVDLNPVRAGIAEGLLDSDFTSIQERLLSTQKNPSLRTEQVTGHNSSVPRMGTLNTLGQGYFREPEYRASKRPPQPLASFGGPPNILPFNEKDYIALVKWTGKVTRQGVEYQESIIGCSALDRIGLDTRQWLTLVTVIHRTSLRMIGRLERVREVVRRQGGSWIAGQSRLEKAYGKG